MALLTFKTEVNGDLKITKERGPYLVSSLGLSCRFLFSLGCSSRPNTKYFFPHRTQFQFLCPYRIAQQAGQAAMLGRLSLSMCLWF
jgi:hypothetical protein